jgi:pimeloyl-ACP methyl ester carboxylesterase
MQHMQRYEFQHDNLTFSYLDSGGPGPAVVALHGHWMEAKTFDPLAETLAPVWRFIALDQRGHGNTSHAVSYARKDYLGDISALLDHLGINQAVMLGHSLGGVNAYQFAALYPQRVRGLVIEDIGADIAVDASFVLR